MKAAMAAREAGWKPCLPGRAEVFAYVAQMFTGGQEW